MSKSVKIKQLPAPSGDPSVFDPGRFLSELEFYETDDPITEDDRDGLAQLVHGLAFLALRSKSTNWESSTIALDSTAFAALDSHFAHLDGWSSLFADGDISYRELASFLVTPYPPRRPARD